MPGSRVFHKLAAIDIGIEGAAFDQIGVPALCHDLALLQYDDIVSCQNGADALGNHKAGATLHQVIQRILNEHFGLNIYGAGRIVQDQDARVEQQGPCNGDPLLLPAAQGRAALADRRSISFREADNEVMGGSGPCGADHLFVRSIWPAEGDVVPDAPCEEIGFLQDDADLPTQRFDGHVAHIIAVNEDAPVGDVVKTWDQVDDAALTAAGCAKNRDRLAWLCFETDIA